MARLPDLVGFCQTHNLKLGTIADLIAYRLRNDSVVNRTVETTLTRNHGGDFQVFIYESDEWPRTCRGRKGRPLRR